MTTSEDNITALVKDTNQLMALADAQPSAAINSLAGHTTDLAALAPAAAAITTNAENIAAIQAVEGHADNAEAARDAAQTAAQQVVDNSGVPPILANAIRAEYKIAGRMPSVVIDPVKGVFFAPDKPMPLTSLVDFSRSSEATQIDRNGNLQTVADNVPRSDHHMFETGIWRAAGLRIAPQATNMLKNSTSMTGTGWSLKNVTATESPAPSSNISSTLTRFDAIAVHGDYTAPYYGLGSLTSGKVYTASVFVQVGSGIPYLELNVTTCGAVKFDTSDWSSTVRSGDVLDHGTEDWGNGLIRCWFTGRAASDSYNYLYCFLNNNSTGYVNTIPPGLDADAHIFLGNAQFEENVVPTTYVESESSPATRASETISIPAENLPQSTTGYSFLFEGLIDWSDDDATHPLLFWGGATVESRLRIEILAGSSHNGIVQAVKDGAFASSSNYAIQEDMKVPFKIAARFSAAEVTLAVNGTAFTSAHATGLADPSPYAATLLGGFTGTLSKFCLFDTPLTEDALITATAP